MEQADGPGGRGGGRGWVVSVWKLSEGLYCGPVGPHAVTGAGMQQALNKDLFNERDKEIFKYAPFPSAKSSLHIFRANTTWKKSWKY